MALQPTPGVAGGPIEVSAGLKRAISVDVTNKDDMLEIMPLGAGSEVGRSCVLASYRNKTVMFDCGVHPGYAGIASLPYFDEVDLSTVDAMLITHFHLDHCAAVPFVVGRTNFKGRILMTHPTKAIFAMLMQDFVKLNKQSENSEALFGEKDVAECMKRIEVIDFHQEMDIGGIKVTPYRAGHVLGACMFYVDIGGLRVLYTGDYSRRGPTPGPAARRHRRGYVRRVTALPTGGTRTKIHGYGAPSADPRRQGPPPRRRPRPRAGGAADP